MDNNEYEILPHEELQSLRKEVEMLKTNPLGEAREAQNLKTSVDQLTEAIHTMIKFFSGVNKEMMEDFKQMSVNEHFSHLSKQNETIAQGLLSVAEMLKKYHKEDKDAKTKDMFGFGSNQQQEPSAGMPGSGTNIFGQPQAAPTPSLDIGASAPNGAPGTPVIQQSAQAYVDAMQQPNPSQFSTAPNPTPGIANNMPPPPPGATIPPAGGPPAPEATPAPEHEEHKKKGLFRFK